MLSTCQFSFFVEDCSSWLPPKSLLSIPITITFFCSLRQSQLHTSAHPVFQADVAVSLRACPLPPGELTLRHPAHAHSLLRRTPAHSPIPCQRFPDVCDCLKSPYASILSCL